MPKAKRLKVDRLEMYPKDQVQGSGPVPLDDTLTSLHWLQNFSILSSERPSGPGCPSSQEQLFHQSLGTDSADTGMPQYLGSDSTSGPLFSNVDRYPRIQMETIPLVEVDYKTNPKAIPPHSHAALICMAIQASKQPHVTLSVIYEWIQENFCYYKHAKPTWQNCIRHTLSLNKCFKKVPRGKDEPGKGGFWQINPEHSDMFVKRIFRRRKRFQGYQGTARASVNEGTIPEKKPLSSTDNRGTTSSTETPLHLDILAAACNEVLGGSCSTLEDLDLTTAPRTLECEMEGMQQPTGELARWCGGGGGDGMNQPFSYGYMDQCVTTMDGTGNLAEFQRPLQYQYQHQNQQDLLLLEEFLERFSEQSGVGEVQPWAEVKVATETVPPTPDQGFGLSEGFFTATCDHPQPTTLTVL